MALIIKKRKHFRLSFNHLSFGYDLFMKFWHLYKAREIHKLLSLTGNERVADIGGGTGHYSRYFSQFCKEVYLLDSSPGMIAKAKPLKNLQIHIGDACSTPFEKNSFDLILLTDVIHHIEEQEKLLREIHRILKPGGTLVIYDFDADHLITKIIGLFEHILFGGLKYLNPEEIQKLLKNSGFTKKILKSGRFYYIFSVTK